MPGAIASNLTEYTTVVTAPKEQEFEINKIDLGTDCHANGNAYCCNKNCKKQGNEYRH